MTDTSATATSLASREYWDTVWSGKKRVAKKARVPFQNSLMKYLPHDERLSCIELGCIPGNFMVFMKQNLGYRIFGVDYSNAVDVLRDTMRSRGISDFVFFSADIRTWSPPMKFDVVCSFGLVEHFLSTESIIEKHIEMMTDHGFLVIEVPNFRYFQYMFHLLLDVDNLRRHNTKAMRRKYVENLLQGYGLEVLYSGYEGEFSYWQEPQGRNTLQRLAGRGIYFLTPLIRRATGRSRNRLISPYLIWIARKS